MKRSGYIGVDGSGVDGSGVDGLAAMGLVHSSAREVSIIQHRKQVVLTVGNTEIVPCVHHTTLCSSF